MESAATGAALIVRGRGRAGAGAPRPAVIFSGGHFREDREPAPVSRMMCARRRETAVGWTGRLGDLGVAGGLFLFPVYMCVE